MKSKTKSIVKIYLRIFILLYILAVIFSLFFNRFNPYRYENKYSCFELDAINNCSFFAYLINSIFIFPLLLLFLFPIFGIIPAIVYGDLLNQDLYIYLLFIIPILTFLYYTSIPIVWLYFKLRKLKWFPFADQRKICLT